jgi:hypothetical protein
MEGIELYADAEPKPPAWWQNQRVASVFVGGLVVGCLFSLLVGSSPELPQSRERTASTVAASLPAPAPSFASETVTCASAPMVVAAVEPAPSVKIAKKHSPAKRKRVKRASAPVTTVAVARPATPPATTNTLPAQPIASALLPPTSKLAVANRPARASTPKRQTIASASATSASATKPVAKCTNGRCR